MDQPKLERVQEGRRARKGTAKERDGGRRREGGRRGKASARETTDPPPPFPHFALALTRT